MGSNPGIPSSQLPPGEDEMVRRQRDQERQAQEDRAARTGQAMQVGAGGILIDGGGSLTISGGGSLNVGSGALNSAGSISAGTTITAGTTVSATTFTSSANANIGGDIGLSGYLFTAAGYAYDITYTRRAAWLGNDGRLGWASSSISAKEIVDSIEQPDALKILEVTSFYYERKAERAKRDDKMSPDYRGPDYHVAMEWGAIAEQLHDLGLWQAVIYEWELEWELADVLDELGDPIVDDAGLHLKERVGEPSRIGEAKPVGVHYELLGLLGIQATRFVWSEHQALVAEVAAIRAQVQGL